MWLSYDVALLGLFVWQQSFTQLSLASKLESRVPAEFALKTVPDVLSPQDMLTLPRPGTPLLNPAGDLALIHVRRYSFDDRKKHRSLAITTITVGSPPYELPLPDGGELFWLDDRTMAHVVETGTDDEGKQEMFTIPVTSTASNISVGQSVSIGSFPVTTATDFRYAYDAGRLVFSAYVHADGDLNLVKENDKKYENRGDSALVYDETFERHWDTWVGPKHKSLFTVQLVRQSNGTFVLGDDFTDVLKGTALSSPVEPFGGLDDFDVSSNQIIFTAKDPELPKAIHTKQNIYLVGFDGSNLMELTSGVHGATRAPVFSHQGTKVAWLQLDEDGYEADRAKVVIRDLEKDVSFTITQDWDRSPRALAFSRNGDFIYFVTEDIARVKIFTLPIPPTPSESTAHPTLVPPYNTPVALTDTHTVSGLQVLSDGRLLFMQSSLASPDDAYVLDNLQQIEADILRNASSPVKAELGQITNFSAAPLQGKYLHPGEDFWFKGAEQDIHGWILTPPGYEPTDVKKWPVVLSIHGGPEGAWIDSWDSWNLNIFASQGYVAVAINPTGSTSFGHNLTEGVKGDWGEKPFVDLRNGWEYLLKNYPQIDPERAVAAGASFGGYAINWIQGNPDFGFGFKALVSHAGIFDTTYFGYATDELFFPNDEWGGRPWEEESFALSRKYSPAYTVQKWSTPQLIIHGSKDYRIPESDSIAVWHALQQLGVPSRLVIFPDENHWMKDAGNSLKWHYEVFKWFDKFVGENASVPLRN
ncbi:Alpha/Beta hydrolase protein [Chiua virens]|nr:Alpha/Beta hydrolase protein [Chiua virens]